MNTQTYIEFVPKFLEKLKNDGMSSTVIDVSKWITEHFKKYCLSNEIQYIDMEVIKNFYLKQYDIDIYDLKYRYQTILRRPLLILMEYYQSGNYYKTHQKSSRLEVSKKYFSYFEKIQNEYINKLNINIKSKKRKLWLVANFFNYLDSNSIILETLKIDDITKYIESLATKYENTTLRIIKSTLREVLNYLSSKNLIYFTGKQAFPLIRKDSRSKLLSSYTNEEIKSMLDVIDNSTPNGKCIYLIISLLAYYGLRAGDIINLKYENFDFEKNILTIIQNKTNKELILPLIDEIKFPLLDYLKNGRKNSIDKNYILSTMYAPYTKFNSTSSLYRIVQKVMDLAEINYENKKHGPHALRHSLATNMINQNVPISAISATLGHSDSKTTEIYITKDTTHLKELTLEVPYEI